MNLRAVEDADGDGRINEEDAAAAAVQTGPVDADGDGKINEEEDPPVIARARLKVERELTVFQKRKESHAAAYAAVDQAEAKMNRAAEMSNAADEEYSTAVRALDKHFEDGGVEDDTARELSMVAFQKEERAAAAEKLWKKSVANHAAAETKADKALAPSRDRLESALDNYHEAHSRVAETHRQNADIAGKIAAEKRAEIDAFEIEYKGYAPDEPDEDFERKKRLIEVKKKKLARLDQEHAEAEAIAVHHEKRAAEVARITGNDDDGQNAKRERALALRKGTSFEDFNEEEDRIAEAAGHSVQTGPKGGRYYLGPSGERVYVD